MTTTASRPTRHPREVFNQPPPLEEINPLLADAPLREAVERELDPATRREVEEFGALAGSRRVVELGFAANRNPPELASHDRFGHRIDEVRYHPAYHELMRIGIEAEIHARPWRRPGPGSHLARLAKHYLLTQAEAGVLCPLTMTFAAVPSLRLQPDLAADWVPRATSNRYDSRPLPAAEKRGCTMGMAMTERQGGSDVRANTTRAAPAAAPGPGREYRLDGHKWFCSAPMSDAFLTLAQAPGGLSCFLVPRRLPDGARNPFLIQRLKDKLGNRSNASSEIEYRDTAGWLVGEEGRGVPTIIEMVNHTRLDCVAGSAALMRQALAQATHHARHRRAFGKRLAEQPLMRNVLADLALESEAATALLVRLARAYERAESDPAERAFRRVATAIAKYWVCKRGPGMVAEALECLGGNGYVEESILPRLYREIPLSSIWEGSGNVICLDVLRTLERQPGAREALLDELATVRAADRRYAAHLRRLEPRLAGAAGRPERARALVEDLALALQARQLLEHAPGFVAETFCAARLAGESGREYGTLPSAAPLEALVARATPAA